MIKFIFLVTFAILAVTASLHINLQTQLLNDEFGRSRFFHGVNVVNKIFPFYPDTDVFNTNTSLCQQDLQNLRAWGMNVIRLHVAWEGIQPTRDFINETYILKLRDIVRMCAKYNISVLLDAHQDLFSKKFCGEGFPDWAVKRTTFPWPLPYKIRFDKQGYPLRQDCDKVNFAKFYLTRDVNQFQQQFYTNQNGLADQFANMWQQVGRFMRYQPNILGYDILNQPFGGNLYRNVFNFVGANNRLLLPFYKKVYEKIRQVDKNNIILFEPSIIDVFGLGFLNTPGGKQELSKQMMSYHLYCPLKTNQGEPIIDQVCEYWDHMTLQLRRQNTKYLKIGGMLTQFGALSNSDRSITEVLRITRYSQKIFHSWIYWQFKYYNDLTTEANPPSTESFYYDNGTLQAKKVRALSHPYAYAVCGQFLTSQFTTTSFRLVWKPGQCKLQTQIYINEPLYFPDSFSVRFSPQCSQCHLQYIQRSYYKVVVPSSISYHKITLDVIGHL